MYFSLLSLFDEYFAIHSSLPQIIHTVWLSALKTHAISLPTAFWRNIFTIIYGINKCKIKSRKTKTLSLVLTFKNIYRDQVTTVKYIIQFFKKNKNETHFNKDSFKYSKKECNSHIRKSKGAKLGLSPSSILEQASPFFQCSNGLSSRSTKDFSKHKKIYNREETMNKHSTWITFDWWEPRVSYI